MNIIAAIKKQTTHIMYILILMTEVCVIGCNSHLHTHSSATLGHACTHNMSTTQGKHKHTTNKHGPLPPHPPAVWHEKPHDYKVRRGSSGQHTLPVLYLMLRSTEYTHHTRALCRQQCTPDRQ